MRVHVIGTQVLICRIDSQESEKTKIDWRNYDLENTPHKPFILDSEIREKCVSLVKCMSLEFGMIDMIFTPSEWSVFLECNLQGHWAWIEQLTGLSITQTLCERLLSGLS